MRTAKWLGMGVCRVSLSRNAFIDDCFVLYVFCDTLKFSKSYKDSDFDIINIAIYSNITIEYLMGLCM